MCDAQNARVRALTMTERQNLKATPRNAWCAWVLEYVPKMMIYCCGCEKKIDARLTNGGEVYPRTLKLQSIPFWKCDTCGNHVGCHHKTKSPTNPLGVIATPELKRARQFIHALIDPIWRNKYMTRNEVYALMAKKTGRKKYHTANIRTIEEARDVYLAGKEIIKELKGKL
jgi:hypothetical protein